jgi:uncharacterized protein (DUF302 family)
MVHRFAGHSLRCVTAVLLTLMSLAAPVPAADDANPALWKATVRGDYARVLAGVKAGLEAAQFQILGEDNLSRGLENNMETFGADKWNSIGFGNVTAVHFCSLTFNQQVFNMNMDWSVLCPFKVVVLNMKAAPERITLILTRPTWILARDPHPEARRIGETIENRILAALREGAGL